MAQAANEDLLDSVLLTTFKINGRRYKVLLNHGTLIWETEKSPVTRYSLHLNDVIGVDYDHSRDYSCCSNSQNRNTIEEVGNEDAIEEFTSHSHGSFFIHYTFKEKNNKWVYCKLSLAHKEPRIVDKWLTVIKTFLKGFTQRPKNLLIFVNPFGGKKRGLKIYEKKVKPLLDLAGIKVDLRITQRANHAKETLLTENLDGFDGIVCVGGDGTFSEIMNGLIIRTTLDHELEPSDLDCEYPRPKIRVGVIPGGSTDTIAYCIHGTTDIRTAVLHIIIGQSTGLDVSSVHNKSKLLCFYASVMSYGYLGDIIRDSDNFRWMGPKRYNYSGFKSFIANHGYEGEIVFSVNESSAPLDSKCLKDCRRCQSQRDLSELDSQPSPETNELKRIRGKFLMVSGANLSCACPRSPNGISPHCHLGDGCLDLVLVHHTSLWNNLRLLLTLSNRMKSIYDLPFVEVHRTTHFTFQALPIPARRSSDFSVWNCDGEVVADTCLFIRTHCQLIEVFFRGVESCLEDEVSGCFCL
nr:ceramide kinase [Sogatella furcifera]